MLLVYSQAFHLNCDVEEDDHVILKGDAQSPKPLRPANKIYHGGPLDKSFNKGTNPDTQRRPD